MLIWSVVIMRGN